MRGEQGINSVTSGPCTVGRSRPQAWERRRGERGPGGGDSRSPGGFSHRDSQFSSSDSNFCRLSSGMTVSVSLPLPPLYLYLCLSLFLPFSPYLCRSLYSSISVSLTFSVDYARACVCVCVCFSVFVSPCLCLYLCVCGSVSCYVSTFHYLCLFTSLPLSLFVSVSVSLSFTTYPSPATTTQHMWAEGLTQSLPSGLLTPGSCSKLPNPGLSCPPFLGLGGGGRGRKGGQPGGPTPFCLSRLGGWASGPFNQPGQAVPDTSPGCSAWLPWSRQL